MVISGRLIVHAHEGVILSGSLSAIHKVVIVDTQKVIIRRSFRRRASPLGQMPRFCQIASIMVDIGELRWDKL